jgi:hypothetical protein
MKLFYILLYEFILINCLRLNKVNNKETDQLANLSDSELEKMMKDYGISTADLEKSSPKDKKQNPLNMLEPKIPSSIDDVIKLNKEALKKFQITSKNAFDLLNFLRDYKIFSRLPITAQNIVANSIMKKSYLDINKSHKNKTDEMNILISNTLNSQVILDHDSRMGRKGMLTLVDKDNAEVIQTWAILNNKVFCFYKSSNYLHIVKIFRVAIVQVKDYPYSPCFFLYYNNLKESQALVCAINVREKEYWIASLNYHKEQYNNK